MAKQVLTTKTIVNILMEEIQKNIQMELESPKKWSIKRLITVRIIHFTQVVQILLTKKELLSH